MNRPDDIWVPGPFRVRHEPPTIKEAIDAAEAMSIPPEQQAEFAAGLMGIPVEEVKPFVRTSGGRRAGEGRSVDTARGAVVVERKIRRFARP